MENMIISNDENMRSPKHEMLKYGDMEIWRNHLWRNHLWRYGEVQKPNVENMKTPKHENIKN